MAALCNYSLPFSLVTASSCHSNRVGSALDLWGLRVLFYFSCTILLSMSTGRLIKLSGLDQGQLKCLCLTLAVVSPVSFKCMCASTHVHTCIWPQPAEYPTACLIVLLRLPAEVVWSVLGPVPNCVGRMVSTTHCIWCQGGSQLVPRPCFFTKLVWEK